MARAKPHHDGGKDVAKGKAKAASATTEVQQASEKHTPVNVARRLKTELQRLRDISNSELDKSESTALGREFTSESYLEHSDPHIRLLVASCVTELLRVTAPETPFSDHELYEVFVLLVRVLRETTKNNDIAWFTLLETLASVKMCNLAVGLIPDGGHASIDDDHHPDSLVIDIFRCLFERIQDDHSAKVEANMVSIMVGCLEECDVVSPALLETLLEPLLHGDQNPRAYHMAQQVIEKASDHLQNALNLFFNSVLVDASTAHVPMTSDLKDHVHSLIYETHKIQPSLLLYVLPNVCLQLHVDDMETRSNAIALMGRLFASSHADYGAQYLKNFREFLGRFRDVKKEIRLQMITVCSIVAQRKPDLAPLIDAELQLRLQDPEWDVRRLVVNEICDLATHSLSSVSTASLREVGERMKDKKVVIRKEAMTGLAQIYAAHVSISWTTGSKELSHVAHQLSWIPDYVLKCFAYPTQELRLRVVQLIDDILLPKQSTELFRMKGLLFIWKHLDGGSREALRRVFLERMQCRKIIQQFVALKQQFRQEKTSDATNRSTLQRSLKEIQPLLPETEGLSGLVEKLATWKDMKLVKHLEVMCSATSDSTIIRQAREDLVKMTGSKTPLGDFMKNICRKLAMTTVNASSVGCLLEILKDDPSKACAEVLHLIGTIFPHLLTSHIETVDELLVHTSPSSSQHLVQTCLLDLLVSYAKHDNVAAAPPQSLKTALLKHCTKSDSLDVVKKCARILVKLFPGEVGKFTKKLLLPSAELSDGALQTLVVFTKHVPNVVPDAVALFELVVGLFDTPAKKGETKCLALSLLCHLVLYHHVPDPREDDASDSPTHCRHVLDLSFHLLQTSTTKATTPFRTVAATNLLKLTRVARLERQFRIDEWHTLGYVMVDSDESVRRAFLKKLTANLLRHPALNHKYVSYLALASSEPVAELKKEARTLLQSAVQRMRHMYEAARSNADNPACSLMVPEYVIPYVIHLVLHAPWEGESTEDVESVFFLLESLVSHVASEADNISFLLQMLHKLSLCHDATTEKDESAKDLYQLIDAATAWLKKRIKNQINLKAYPGQIYLPKQLFQPGKTASPKPIGRTTTGGLKVHDEDDGNDSVDDERVKRKRPSAIKTDKVPKKIKVTASPKASKSPVVTPTRRMPARNAKCSDVSLADQDSDVDEDEHEASPRQHRQTPQARSATLKSLEKAVLNIADDDDETKSVNEAVSDDETKSNGDATQVLFTDEASAIEIAQKSQSSESMPAARTSRRASATSSLSVDVSKEESSDDDSVEKHNDNDDKTTKMKKRRLAGDLAAPKCRSAKQPKPVTPSPRRSSRVKAVIENTSDLDDACALISKKPASGDDDEEMTSFRRHRRRG
ncbi:hypothetical protein H310_06611 [Aphanomyces invadans]|uniref:Sister chromatid cohesion protein PDS5 n=1 Tax=Aphanomyces invadans TaxID=157072 RepID=A0A024U3J1_9STRA|nr:hypothetical protein H310_06611 [Aphanomyces invadans]ETW00966.1 hypothetical protein H310_06611 [Aphanomyces invadans]|eukprot:XP_008869964.1 hypothetical protein H310_06611 [Aphanomyces invadans]